MCRNVINLPGRLLPLVVNIIQKKKIKSIFPEGYFWGIGILLPASVVAIPVHVLRMMSVLFTNAG